MHYPITNYDLVIGIFFIYAHCFLPLGRTLAITLADNFLLRTSALAYTVEIALEEGVIEIKNKIIQDSTHTNAMYQHISPREELIKQAKELRKSIYKIDETMHEKCLKKERALAL